MSMESARDFFNKSDESKRLFRLATEIQLCNICEGDGKCNYCWGQGKYHHDCDCAHCDTHTECVECNNGKCARCGGKGETMLNERELRQAGMSKAEARNAR